MIARRAAATCPSTRSSVSRSQPTLARAAARRLRAPERAAEVACRAARAVAQQALSGLRDPEALRSVALGADDAVVAKAAVKKITDQALLTEIAETAPTELVRRSAVKRLSDETALADVVQHHEVGANVRKPAVDKIHDEQVLATIVADDPDPDVRRSALDDLTLRQERHLVGHLARETHLVGRQDDVLPTRLELRDQI